MADGDDEREIIRENYLKSLEDGIYRPHHSNVSEWALVDIRTLFTFMNEGVSGFKNHQDTSASSCTWSVSFSLLDRWLQFMFASSASISDATELIVSPNLGIASIGNPSLCHLVKYATLANRQQEFIIIPQSPILNKLKTIQIRDCHNCIIHIHPLDSLHSVEISNCIKTRIIIAPIPGTIAISNCESIKLSAPFCNGISAVDCTGQSVLNVTTMTQPLLQINLEQSVDSHQSTIILGPCDVWYYGMRSHISKCLETRVEANADRGLEDPWMNLWDTPRVFKDNGEPLEPEFVCELMHPSRFFPLQVPFGNVHHDDDDDVDADDDEDDEFVPMAFDSKYLTAMKENCFPLPQVYLSWVEKCIQHVNRSKKQMCSKTDTDDFSFGDGSLQKSVEKEFLAWLEMKGKIGEFVKFLQ
ncbi:hypothetical protein BDR26DRAFT_852653 [Obelidium mucronatum]|nr:hypothetical protein BDR26DRAFT_852653 [Obelidium mucronatum]